MIHSAFWPAAMVLLFASLTTPVLAQDRMEAARSRLAQLDGRVPVGGLDSAVEVRRDSSGVPHIYAKTVRDLFVAQGYVAAQDRLWQMEMWRRQGDGLLADVLGPSFVERDRFARLLRYRGDMEAEWASYAPDTKMIVRSFVAGVNAYIRAVRDRPPIEFTMLGFVPQPWNDEVPLQRMAALAMTGNALAEVNRAKLLETYGPELVRALFPVEPDRALDPVPGLDLRGVSIASLGAAAESYGGLKYPRFDGSNNWVVSGRHTASGKPLLANDPHRAVTLPSLRYMSHLVAPGWNVIGAGEPAVPGVAGGHNERIAFGFTIVGMDQQDVYVETLGACPGRTGGPRCYRHNGQWEPVRTIRDTIPVKGERPRIVDLEFTHHGPIVAEDSAGRAFAIRFVGSEPGTAGYLAQISINRAYDWASFTQAAYRWKLPTENLVYADVDGNIGWIAAGLDPIRSWSGLLPVPGDGRYEWEGFLPFAKLPQTLNPESGIIATANNNVLPKGYAEDLNYEWATPYRHDRIIDVLSSRGGWTRQGFERLQHDEFSTPASLLVPAILSAADRRGLSGDALRHLRSWDYVMRRDDVAPTIYEAWLGAVRPLAYARQLGPGMASNLQWDLPTVVRLLTEPVAAPALVARDSIVLTALSQATATLRQELGPDPAAWRYGRVHVAQFRHALSSAYDLEAAPRGGDGSTVNMTGGAGWLQTHGASYRGIFDLADWDNSVATTVPGQSGQPGSPYYDNLLRPWANGEYFPLAYTRAAVERLTAHVLWLDPKR